MKEHYIKMFLIQKKKDRTYEKRVFTRLKMNCREKPAHEKQPHGQNRAFSQRPRLLAQAG